MVKGRKKIYINQLRESDKKFATTLANCRYIQKSDLKAFGLSEKRLLNYQRDNLVEQKVFYNKESKKDEVAYCLTGKGETFFRRNLNIEYFYSSTSISHDLKLKDFYLSLDEEKQARWITENEFKQMKNDFLTDLKDTDSSRYYDLVENDSLSCTDGGYFDVELNTIVCVEVIGNYNKSHIEHKVEFVSVLGGGAWQSIMI